MAQFEAAGVPEVVQESVAELFRGRLFDVDCWEHISPLNAAPSYGAAEKVTQRAPPEFPSGAFPVNRLRSLPMNRQRSAGVILHPTCLPSRFGIGDFGPTAAAYVEWLAGAGVRWWQILPLHPPGPGESPYSAISTFAGNELLISPDLLVEDGVLEDSDVAEVPPFPNEWVEFADVVPFKLELLRKAFRRFSESQPPGLMRQLADFRDRNRAWLPGLCHLQGSARQPGAARPGTSGRAHWPCESPMHSCSGCRRTRTTSTSSSSASSSFSGSGTPSASRAREMGVAIFGDVPIFVAGDSAEVWAHPELFQLNDEQAADGGGRVCRRTTFQRPVSCGATRSTTGSAWKNDGYAWWVERLRHTLSMVDMVRLDHFRGFATYWEVPAEETTAINGRWLPGPGRQALRCARRRARRSSPGGGGSRRDHAGCGGTAQRSRDARDGDPPLRIQPVAALVVHPLRARTGPGGLHGHPRQQHHGRLVPRGRKRGGARARAPLHGVLRPATSTGT